MGGQIVQDDEVAGLEGRGELGFDVSLEDAPIHRRIDDEWRGERATAQAGDEGLRLPMAERDLGKKPLAFGATAAQAGHLGGGSGLVEEDQPMRLKPISGWRTPIHSSRACLTSGRSCSLARRVLWNGPPLLPAS
jgi:hypothetical protein